MSLRSVQVVACITGAFFSLLNSFPLMEATQGLFNRSPVEGHWLVPSILLSQNQAAKIFLYKLLCEQILVLAVTGSLLLHLGAS